MIRIILFVVLFIIISERTIFTESKSLSEEGRSPSGEIVYPRVYHMSRKKRDTINFDNEKLVIIRTSNKIFYLELYPNHALFSEELANDLGEWNHTANPCIYQGKILTHSGGMAAISTCSGNGILHGMLLTPQGKYILEPHRESPPLEKESIVPHLLLKADDNPESFCATDHLANHTVPLLPDDEENEITDNKYRVKRAEKTYTIETAVFADKHLLDHYSKQSRKDVESYARDMIFNIMNQVALIYKYASLETRINIAICKYEILKSEKNSPSTANGNIDTYLDNFSKWQEGLDNKYDHSILLTGLDLYKQQTDGRNSKVLGLAWVNGMCRPKYSCTLNEGVNFEAAFVIAHEMGHCLSMLHDGTNNNCDSTKYIMSPKTGAGKSNWSPCSNKYLKDFIGNGYARCLEKSSCQKLPSMDFDKEYILPGQIFPPREQCKLALGQEYQLYNKPPYNEICRELWCVAGSWATSAHPALDGSQCGSGKICLEGKCVPIRKRSSSSRITTEVPEQNQSRTQKFFKYLEKFADAVKKFFG